MVKVREDLTGKTFGRLTVIKQTDDYISPNGTHYARWLCKCSCEENNIIKVLTQSLKSKNTQSCGCLQREIMIDVGKASKQYNTYDLDSKNYGIGYTQNGEEFWFDKEDYDKIKGYCWCYNSSNGYLVSESSNSNKHVLLHRLVMGVDNDNIVVDHKNHPSKNEHKIDNRKENLRICTQSQNSMNRSLSKNNKSGVTGVCFDKRRNKWLSYIKINQKQIRLGHFDNLDDAIKTRKMAEIKYFGDYRYDANN